MKKTLVTLAVMAVSTFAVAKDYGVQGNAWPVVEVDIRQMLIEDAARVDWSKVQDDIKHSAETYTDRLPKRALPVAEQTTTYWFDPSFVLSSDINMPVKKADGSYEWRLMYPKGTSVNPLEKYRPTTAMLFVDSSDPEQFKLVQDVLAAERHRVVIVEAGKGDIKQLNESVGRPVFHAPDAMLVRFQVSKVPTLVHTGDGDNRLRLGITNFARPFSAPEVLQAWPDMAKNSKPTGAIR